MEPTKILITGATGFVGGSVLAQLLSTDTVNKELYVAAIVRKQEQVDALSQVGVNATIFNGLDDTVQLREIASHFDIVLHCATGLHTASAEALILGLGDSMVKTGRQCHYIHTTGTSNLAYGMISNPHATISNFSDADDPIYEEELRRHAEQLYTQRRTDLVVIATAERTAVKSYLMMPPTIYGRGLGIFKTQSHQVPAAIRYAFRARHPEYIGDGSGTVGYVHIVDLSALYVLLLAKILAGADLPCGKEGYYFSNTGRFTWKCLCKKIGETGLRLGALESAIPTSITLHEAKNRWGYTEDDQLLLETNFAGRSQTTPKHAFMLGWKPVKSSVDWDAEIEETWKAVLTKK